MNTRSVLTLVATVGIGVVLAVGAIVPASAQEGEAVTAGKQAFLSLRTPGIFWGELDLETAGERFHYVRFEPAGDESLTFGVALPKDWTAGAEPLLPGQVKTNTLLQVGCAWPVDLENDPRRVEFELFIAPINFDPTEWLLWWGSGFNAEFLGAAIDADSGLVPNLPNRVDQALFRPRHRPETLIRVALWSDGPRHWIMSTYYPAASHDSWASDFLTMVASIQLARKTGVRFADEVVRDSHSALATCSFSRPASWGKTEVKFHDPALSDGAIAGLVLYPTAYRAAEETGPGRSRVMVATIPRDALKVGDASEFLEVCARAWRDRHPEDRVEVGAAEEVRPRGPRYRNPGLGRLTKIFRPDAGPYSHVAIQENVWVGEREVLYVVATIDFGAHPLEALSVQHAAVRVVSSLEVR